MIQQRFAQERSSRKCNGGEEMQRASLGVSWVVQETGFSLTLLELHQLMQEQGSSREPVHNVV